MRRVLAAEKSWRPYLEKGARAAATQLSETHQRVRRGGRQAGARTSVRAQSPVDVLGAYVLLPVPGER